MPETEPEARGVLLQLLDDALRDANKLNILTAYSPGVTNRETHLEALQVGIEGLVAVISDANPFDPPDEEES